MLFEGYFFFSFIVFLCYSLSMISTQAITFEQLRKENLVLQDEVNNLKEQLAWFKRNLFGKRSEKIVSQTNEEQLEFEGFDKIQKIESNEAQTIPDHQRRKPKRNGQDKIRFPADLPVETTVLDIPEEQKVCPETGQAFVKIGEEVTYRLAQTPASYFIKAIVRPKYSVPKNPELGVITAPLPDFLLYTATN